MGVVRWILPVGVLTVGVLSGAALAGRPTDSPTVTISGTTAAATAPTTTVRIDNSSTTSTSTSSSQVTTTVPGRESATVLVVNGTARPGLASRGAAVLRDAGWTVFTGDAVNDAETSQVFASERYAELAAEAATALGVTAEPAALTDGSLTVDGATADIVIVLGADSEL